MMVSVNGKNSGHYDSLDSDCCEIIIKKAANGKWEITKKIGVEGESVKTTNFTDAVDWFSLDFSNSQSGLLPSVLGIDYK